MFKVIEKVKRYIKTFKKEVTYFVIINNSSLVLRKNLKMIIKYMLEFLIIFSKATHNYY